MLAISTTQALSLIDPGTLKIAPSSVLSGHAFPQTPTASVWSQDNSALFIAFQESIHLYSPSGVPISEIHSSEEPITCLIAKERGQIVIFGASNNVHILEHGSGVGKICQTLASHQSPVNSLSLSNDGTLLASTSLSTAHVHNLSMGSHTVLRGLPQSGQITTCAFHPHSRTRLLLGMGRQVLVYDTTRPSGPLKAVAMSDASSGDIVALACSPFSKTLVVVATSGGSVGLVDLDKEKGCVCLAVLSPIGSNMQHSLFRTMNLKMPLTTATFSPEGAALYFGTENGKLLMVDLRALEKPPKCINIGEGGHRVECMSFQVSLISLSLPSILIPWDLQKKLKTGVESKGKMVASTSVKATEPLGTTTNATRRPLAIKVVSSPGRAHAKAGSSAGSPARLVRKTTTAPSIRKAATPVKTPKPAEKRVFSPVRDPLNNSSGGDDISGSFSWLLTQPTNAHSIHSGNGDIRFPQEEQSTKGESWWHL